MLYNVGVVEGAATRHKSEETLVSYFPRNGHRCQHQGNTAITANRFENLLAALDADRELAGLKYENIRRRLLKFLECRACPDAEALADETIDRVAARLAEGARIYSQDVCSYFYGVARFVINEYWRQVRRRPIPLTDTASGAFQYQKADEKERVELSRRDHDLQCLDLALESIAPDARKLLLNYYETEMGASKARGLLASELNVRSGVLRLRIHRIKEKVRREFESLRQRGNDID